MTRLGFSPSGKEILKPESFESVALKGLLSRRNRKMSLADGNSFHAKCHLLMIAPFAATASRKTHGSFPGARLWSKFSYFLLPPFFPIIVHCRPILGSPPCQLRPPPGNGQKGAGRAAPGRPCMGPLSLFPLPTPGWGEGLLLHPLYTETWVEGPPQASHSTQSFPCRYTPLCIGVSSLLSLSSLHSKLHLERREHASLAHHCVLTIWHITVTP